MSKVDFLILAAVGCLLFFAVRSICRTLKKGGCTGCDGCKSGAKCSLHDSLCGSAEATDTSGE